MLILGHHLGFRSVPAHKADRGGLRTSIQAVMDIKPLRRSGTDESEGRNQMLGDRAFQLEGRRSCVAC